MIPGLSAFARIASAPRIAKAHGDSPRKGTEAEERESRRRLRCRGYFNIST
jgi:hypothetical protein